MARPVETPPRAKTLGDKPTHEELAQAIAQLKPDEAAFLLHRLEMALRKRNIQVTGYLVALVAWLAGMTLALIYFGTNDASAAWAFIVPFGIAGAILYGFGTWAERVGKRPAPGPPAAPPPT